MNDRELLELAAKAAGRCIVDWICDGNFVPVAVLDDGSRWQPLLENQFTDCMGDALRLAVKLGLDILFTPEDVEVIADQHAKEDGGETVAPWAGESWTLKQQDPYAAARRAIVRAAAETGKAIP